MLRGARWKSRCKVEIKYTFAYLEKPGFTWTRLIKQLNLSFLTYPPWATLQYQPFLFSFLTILHSSFSLPHGEPLLSKNLVSAFGASDTTGPI